MAAEAIADQKHRRNVRLTFWGIGLFGVLVAVAYQYQTTKSDENRQQETQAWQQSVTQRLSGIEKNPTYSQEQQNKAANLKQEVAKGISHQAKPPAQSKRCPASLGNEAFAQAKRINGLRNEYKARIDQIEWHHATEINGETKEQRWDFDNTYKELLTEEKIKFLEQRYIKDYRRQATGARDAILSKLIVPGSSGDVALDDATVPYDHPSTPDDLLRIIKDLENLALACSER